MSAQVRRASARLKGMGASPGIAQGRVHIIDVGFTTPPQYHIKQNEIEHEVHRFDQAVNHSVEQIREIRDRVSGADSGEHMLILEAHLLMLNDAILIEGVRKLIREEKVNAEWALRRTTERIHSMFDGLAHEYFRERGSDIAFIGERILRNLMGKAQVLIEDMPDDAIVVAHDLSAASTAQLSRFSVLALVTEGGTRTSHAAIVARSLHIPAVVGVPHILQLAGTGDKIVVDGVSGEVILAPTKVELLSAKDTATRQRNRERDVIKHAAGHAVTQDAIRIRICGNIEMVSEAKMVLQNGGEGIGLYRTEFLFVGRETPPTEAEHITEYRKLIKCMGDLPVTIRTLDLGGDKLMGMQVSSERNPALGMRAIRLCLQKPELLRTQIRAVLLISQHQQVRLMIPMITQLSELQNVKEIIAEQQAALRREGKPTPDKLSLGMMIETPASALTIDTLAAEVDFFSIGTNDLIQYTLAIDRGNENVAYLYRPLHPAILRLLAQIAEAASANQVPVSVCGEMAAEAFHTPVLIGLGIHEFSMNATAIPWIKKMVRDSSAQKCRALVDVLLALRSPTEVEEHVRRFIKQHYDDAIAELY